jgi:hypothetical protein
MWSRTATALAKGSATFVAGVVMVVANGAASPADQCLGAPQRQTPSGAHWYYRVDHAKHRKCWYLADESPQPGRSTQPRKPDTAARPRGAAARLSASTAEAHAELPPSAKVGGADGSPPVTPSLSARASDAATADASQPSPAPIPALVQDQPPAPPADGHPTQMASNEPAQAQAAMPPQAETSQPIDADTARDAADSPLRTVLALLMIAIGLVLVAASLLLRPPSAVETARSDRA